MNFLCSLGFHKWEEMEEGRWQWYPHHYNTDHLYTCNKCYKMFYQRWGVGECTGDFFFESFGEFRVWYEKQDDEKDMSYRNSIRNFGDDKWVIIICIVIILFLCLAGSCCAFFGS